jgi:hypothetical protein
MKRSKLIRELLALAAASRYYKVSVRSVGRRDGNINVVMVSNAIIWPRPPSQVTDYGLLDRVSERVVATVDSFEAAERIAGKIEAEWEAMPKGTAEKGVGEC